MKNSVEVRTQCSHSYATITIIINARILTHFFETCNNHPIACNPGGPVAIVHTLGQEVQYQLYSPCLHVQCFCRNKLNAVTYTARKINSPSKWRIFTTPLFSTAIVLLEPSQKIAFSPAGALWWHCNHINYATHKPCRIVYEL